MMCRYFAMLAGFALLLLAACGRTDTAAVPIAPSASRGSHSAAILSHAFSAGAVTTVTYDRNGSVAPPNDAWRILPGTLHVAFYPALGLATRGVWSGVRVVMDASPAARAAIAAVTFNDGRVLRFPAPASFDASQRRARIDLPAALLQRATGVTVALATDSIKPAVQPTGPRYWDGKDWDANGTIQTGKKTVVLIHGIFSSVETSFPKGGIITTACPKKIADAQGFQQILGFDYDWFEPPDKEGPLFADFLKQVVDAKPTSLTVEAHSYGTLVALSALPSLGSNANVANAVLMGGPLPLRGTPLAKKDNYWRIGMMLGLLDWYYNDPPSYVDKAFDTGMVASLATNSDALKTILSNVKGMPNKPHFVQAAGTKWICLIGTVGHCAYSEETFKRVLTEDSGVELPWDGVVETIAAESKDVPDAVATPFPLSHIDLECDGSVIKWIAKQLQ
jgi:pimeloyl-ACP methyl ester carboxylesterase